MLILANSNLSHHDSLALAKPLTTKVKLQDLDAVLFCLFDLSVTAGKDQYRKELLDSCLFMLLSELSDASPNGERIGDPESALKHRKAGSGTQVISHINATLQLTPLS